MSEDANSIPGLAQWVNRSSFVINCGVGCRCGLDLALLWLWSWSAAAALIWSLAWELPYAAGVALKRWKHPPQTKQNKTKKHCPRWLRKKLGKEQILLKAREILFSGVCLDPLWIIHGFKIKEEAQGQEPRVEEGRKHMLMVARQSLSGLQGPWGRCRALVMSRMTTCWTLGAPGEVIWACYLPQWPHL